MRTQILQDIILGASQAYPLPDFKDEAATTAWIQTLSGCITHVVYDAILSNPGPAKAALNMTQGADGTYRCDCNTFSKEEVEKAYDMVMAKAPADHRLRLSVNAGNFLVWLKSVDWAKWISLIISLIPKTA